MLYQPDQAHTLLLDAIPTLLMLTKQDRWIESLGVFALLSMREHHAIRRRAELVEVSGALEEFGKVLDAAPVLRACLLQNLVAHFAREVVALGGRGHAKAARRLTSRLVLGNHGDPVGAFDAS